ncbi:MAG: hypothetical protein IJ009_02415 [Clostridia bacterium]|nr:hypothetical protein [Clostridia bacterium]
MCQNCSLALCPSACPERWDGRDTAVCEICDEPIEDGEAFYGNGRYFCADCADELTVDDLIRLCDLTDTADLLHTLGFKRV